VYKHTTSIDCFNVIFKPGSKQADWYTLSGLPLIFSITPSLNGRISDEIELVWLQNVFDKFTKHHTVGRYQLLTLDSHSSHYRRNGINDIISACMRPHSLNLLQRLHMDIFPTLKRYFGRAIGNQMRCGISRIDKEYFLTMLPAIHEEVHTMRNITNCFSHVGIFNY